MGDSNLNNGVIDIMEFAAFPFLHYFSLNSSGSAIRPQLVVSSHHDKQPGANCLFDVVESEQPSQRKCWLLIGSL